MRDVMLSQESKSDLRRCKAAVEMPEACSGSGIITGSGKRLFCSDACRLQFYRLLEFAKRTENRRLGKIKTMPKYVQRVFPSQINTPSGCILIKAKTGRCAHYYDCIHAAACLRLSMALAGEGFATKNGCPGYRPAEDPDQAAAHNPEYVYGNPYPVFCTL